MLGTHTLVAPLVLGLTSGFLTFKKRMLPQGPQLHPSRWPPTWKELLSHLGSSWQGPGIVYSAPKDDVTRRQPLQQARQCAQWGC